jgi:hypothetical protein
LAGDYGPRAINTLANDRLNAWSGKLQRCAKGASCRNGQGGKKLAANQQLHLCIGFAAPGNGQGIANSKL